MASASGSSPLVPRWNYDVFLSFRGEDVRKNFLGHLYSALNQVGFRTYKDDNELARGSDISPSLLEAIEQSRIAMIVFSKNYADSGWCLDELVQILDCMDKLGQMVLPIFFHVQPSDVREQKGSFGEAFGRCLQKVTVGEEEADQKKGKTMEKVGKWKTALTNAANLAGFDLHGVNGDESELIKKIIEDVWEKLHPTYLSDVDRHFGILSLVEKIISHPRLDSKDVCFIGIYGMPGIGKTTIAEAIRNRILSEFEGNCLLEDVQLGSKHGGLVELQKRLLCNILRVQDLHLSGIADGIDKIRSRLKYKRVLIILDNVDHLDQLAALAKEKSWFGNGSRIMVTCRDEHLLNAHGMDAKYEVPSLDFDNAKQLFSWHAFRQLGPPDDCADRSYKIMEYAGGHPLALKVLGSFLSDKTLPEWIGALEELKITLHGEIFERLKLCFDSLNDREKAIFLDIAFFFVGMDKDVASKILDGCGYHTNLLLRILIQKCLLTLRGNELTVHDLLQEMAREIVRRENPAEPGKRSRLSFYKDVRRVLKHDEGTKEVIGLTGIFPRLREKPFSTEALARMNRLRMLQLRNADLDGSWEYFSKDLRWLCWERYPWISMPPNLNLNKLVVLELRYSKLQYMWDQTKVFKKLKVLDLSHSHYLVTISDISGLSSVEKLIFKDCIKLTEIHQSIGKLSKLIYLDLENCKNLDYLPKEICELSFLENLNLSLCSKLEELPKDLGNMKSLKELNIGCTGIKNLPISIGHLKNLTIFLWNNKISFNESRGNYDLSPLWSLASVKELNLSFCNLSDTSLPGDLGGLPNLEMLFLAGNTFHLLPTCLLNLPKLKVLDVSECDLSGTAGPMVVASRSLHRLYLNKNKFCSLPVDLSSLPPRTWVIINGCKKLQAIEAAPCTHLSAFRCTSLEKVTLKGGTKFEYSRFGYPWFFDCPKLVEIPGTFKLKSLTSIQLAKLERLFNLKSLLNKQLRLFNKFTHAFVQGPYQVLCDYMFQRYSIFLPGGMIPDWFNYQSNGPFKKKKKSSDYSGSIVVDLHQSFKGLALCVIYCGSINYFDTFPYLYIKMEDINSPGYYYEYKPVLVAYPEKDDEVMWISYWRAPSLGNECIRFRVKVRSMHFTVKSIGFRLLNEEEIDAQFSEENSLFDPALITEWDCWNRPIDVGWHGMCTPWPVPGVKAR